MEVIFLHDVKNTARKGEVKDISDGFARNYLIPHQLAVPATPVLIQKAHEEQRSAEKQQEEKDKQSHQVVDTLQHLTLSFQEKANEQGTLFTGITREKIAEQLTRQLGYSIEARHIKLDKPIKQSGAHKAGVQFLNHHYQITINVNP